jgi:lysophospholipase L1-like esterase
MHSICRFFLFYSIVFLTGCANIKSISHEKFEKLYPPDSITIIYHTDWTKNHYRERVQEFKKEPLRRGDIVFIGNSITEGGKDWGLKLNLPNVKNRGISGDCTDGVLQRLDEINYFKPKVIFILIGVNDLFNLYYQKQIPSPEYVGINILKIAQTIHDKTPKTIIYVQTILPTSQDFMKENINKVNEAIKAYANDNNYTLIDLHAVFSDEKGFLKKDLTYDGTHLNDAGYKVWVNYINRYVKQ